MKYIIKFKLILLAATLIFGSCSEDLMDNINKELNDPTDVSAKNILPSAILQTAFENTGSDIAWYATVYVEHSAGTWGQSYTADNRIGQNASALLGNNWNSLYETLNSLKIILDKTAPGGPDKEYVSLRGMAQVLTAYNLAILTDGWGSVPYKEAFQGLANMKPKFDKQSDLYGEIQKLLDSAIVNLGKPTIEVTAEDLIYNGDTTLWIKAAWSLKARYYLRLTNVDPQAAQKALDCIPNGFSSNAESFLFDRYENTATGQNPWYQFMNERFHLSSSKTLMDLMAERNDTARMYVYFTMPGDTFVPAPNGEAEQTQNGDYSYSAITENGPTAATPLMTYHELKFIEAEAKRRLNDITYQTALQDAITANYEFHDVENNPVVYFTNSVLPRLTGNLNEDLNEIITQKYIAFYEHEAIEAYNDYRRTGIPKMNNKFNTTPGYGFVNRFPYGISEATANAENMPKIDVFKDKVWWAGGTE